MFSIIFLQFTFIQYWKLVVLSWTWNQPFIQIYQNDCNFWTNNVILNLLIFCCWSKIFDIIWNEEFWSKTLFLKLIKQETIFNHQVRLYHSEPWPHLPVRHDGGQCEPPAQGTLLSYSTGALQVNILLYRGLTSNVGGLQIMSYEKYVLFEYFETLI